MVFNVGDCVEFTRRVTKRSDSYFAQRDRLGRQMPTIRRTFREAREAVRAIVEIVGPLLVYVRIPKDRKRIALRPDQLRPVG